MIGSAGGGPPPAAVALIDGEHYPPVVVDALQALAHRFSFLAALFLGGFEKIKGDDLAATAARIYGLPVHFPGPSGVEGALRQVVDTYRPSVIVDLSDEPVVGYRERFRLISHALARGVAYEGSDFRFSPPRLDRLATNPSLSIIGTAKRVGKTALSGYVARIMEDHLRESTERWVNEGSGIVIVAMGRGGPAEPEIIDGGARVLTANDLLEWSRAGRHAASDHFEDAALSRMTTVGCRRCGGGMAGEPFVSNVAEGARVANGLGPALTIFEGSGAALPPVATDARMLVAGAHQPLEYVTGYLGTYRVLVSDAVVLTMAEEPLADAARVARLVEEVQAIKKDVPVIPVVFRPRPMEPIDGRTVALFTTAPASQEPVLRRYLEERYGCKVLAFSDRLSDRAGLREDLARPEVDKAELLLTEIKAAAIDVVAEEADRRGVPTIFLDNIPIETGGAREGELAETCRHLAHTAARRYGSA
ncbi:MAG: 2,3-diphosphoglycerate synthetase [Actinobacteria bacterium]|nr:2,3-diphosphoglycerate synthetase [Actinomycetota bacterium]